MGEAWQAQRERGSGSLARLIAWIALNVGHGAGQLLLYPICLYFLAFSIRARRASADYLQRVLCRKPRLADLFRHYFCFASTTLDRPYFLTGRFETYDIRMHGQEVLEELRKSGRGAILMGSHIGSFDILRCLADRWGRIELKVMMYSNLSSHMKKIIEEFNPEYEKAVIPLGSAGSVIEAYRTIERGGFVGILADRNSRGDKRLQVPFLGEEAAFPLGPVMLAAAAQCPIVTFFALYRGNRRYDIYFRMLCEKPPSDYRTNQAALHPLVVSFAGMMEKRCREAPYNWFNFYDFWKGDAT